MTVSEPRDYLKRLEALNGGPLKNAPNDQPDREEIRRIVRKQVSRKDSRPADRPIEPVVLKRDLPRTESGRGKPAAWRPPSDTIVSLEEVVRGEEIDAPQGGKAYLVAKRLVDCAEPGWEFSEVCRSFCCGFERTDSDLRRRLSDFCNSRDLLPEDILFVDLETCGLGNAPLFLVGTMFWEEGSLVVRQYLARDYSEEPAVTSLFVDTVRDRSLLVTFNGKTFDMPYIRTRAAANGIRFTRRLPHLDLLHECRRVWRHALPNCKLQTLERHICGRTREGDIPGCEIPEAYHAYVRTSNAVQIVEIMKHNMLDLITMADLIIRLP